MTSTALRRTPLYPQHIALGARLMPFAGWEMPLQYAGILSEHQAVRQRAGLFDVSHMGRLDVRGLGAGPFLRSVTTYDVTGLAPGHGHYSLLCDDDGGILDDIYIYRLSEERFLAVTNAANAERDRDWICSQRPDWAGVDVHDVQTQTAMMALQGPDAVDCLAKAASPSAVDGIAPRRCIDGLVVAGRPAFLSRTGYTGEDGYELVVAAEDAPVLWRAFMAMGVQPCGLGARDTLRLEAALALYGHDIDTTINPFEAGLGWVVTFDDGADFVGREALLSLRGQGPRRALVCLAATAEGIPRPGCPVLHAGQPVGRITSGTFSPTLRRGIALAYLPVALKSEGTELIVDVRGKPLPVRIVKRPFYKRQTL